MSHGVRLAAILDCELRKSIIYNSIIIWVAHTLIPCNKLYMTRAMYYWVAMLGGYMCGFSGYSTWHHTKSHVLWYHIIWWGQHISLAVNPPVAYYHKYNHNHSYRHCEWRQWSQVETMTLPVLAESSKCASVI